MIRSRLVRCVLALAFSGGAPVFGWETGSIPPPGSDDWRELAIPGVERQTAYSVYEDGGRRVLRAESECGASGVAVPIDHVELDRTPVLRWAWRIEDGLQIADERTKSGDDFAARVIVMFEYDPDQASLVERALHRLAETLRGEKLPGRSLAYVWTSAQPFGAAWRSPYRTPTYLISRGAGQSSEWVSLRANVHEDYVRHWQAEPPPLVGLAILTDADNTCGTAVAHYARFRFTADEE